MAKKTAKQWMYSPKSTTKPKVPEAVKLTVQRRSDDLVVNEFRPRFIQPPPDAPQFNYIVDLYNHWRGSFFYFCAKYRCPSPHCISEYFEVRDSRLEYQANGNFTMSYMRHTGKWQEVFMDLSLDECLEQIEANPLFQP